MNKTFIHLFILKNRFKNRTIKSSTDYKIFLPFFFISKHDQKGQKGTENNLHAQQKF